MHQLMRTVVVFLVLLLPGTATAEFEKNIMTGGPAGTYIQIGRDIAGIGAQCGLTLNVVESAGSLENFVGVRKRRHTQFGIVQSDVLEYLKTYAANDPEIQQAVRGVRIMFPLYNEEVHLLARREIGSVRDLAGKRVAIGKEDSGTFLTASLVLDILRVEADRRPIGATEALDRLVAGEIDAFFYVAGAPASLFADDRIDPQQFHLVAIEDAPLRATYLPATIPADAYPWLEADTSVVAVKAVLMNFDFDPGRNAYHRESCKAVSDFASLILTRLDALRSNGHPKWRAVDLTAVPPGWQVGSCVKAGMALDYKVECGEQAAGGADDGTQQFLDLLKQRLQSSD